MDSYNSELKVSVIVPCYQAEHYLLDCIDSVLSQTHNNIEVLLVDDGSTDNTKVIIEELALKDQRIKYIYQENAGSAVARNVGVKAATGEYIAFIDADDLWPSYKLELQLKALDENEAYDCVCGIDQHVPPHFVLENSKFNSTNSPLSLNSPLVNQVRSGWQLNSVLKQTYFHINNLLLSKKVALKLKFNKTLRRGQDSHYWLQLCHQFPVLYLNHVLSYYRIHPESITHQLSTENIRLKLVDMFFAEFGYIDKGNNVLTKKERNRVYFSLHFNYAVSLREQHQYWNSITSLVSSMRYKPLELGIYKNFALCLVEKLMNFPFTKKT